MFFTVPTQSSVVSTDASSRQGTWVQTGKSNILVKVTNSAGEEYESPLYGQVGPYILNTGHPRGMGSLFISVNMSDLDIPAGEYTGSFMITAHGWYDSSYSKDIEVAVDYLHID